MANNLLIADRSLACDCPCTGEVCALVMGIVLHFPSMDHNQMLPFKTISGGVVIHDIPKMHYEDPIVDDNIISFEYYDLRIPLQLNDVFSHFHTRVPTEREPHECKKLSITSYPSD